MMLRLENDGKNVVSIASSGAASDTATTMVDMLLLKVVKLAEKEVQQKMLEARLHGLNLNFGAVCR